ncbi:MAG: hypothetical protein JWP97_6759 [Labilithrix sp.]|nr:hypothetical protein [Labilithrix sp.]
MTDATCQRVPEALVALASGEDDPALDAHVAGCDACRDARHDLESSLADLAGAGDDFVLTPALTERLVAIANDAAPRSTPAERVSVTRMRDSASAGGSTSPRGPPSAAASTDAGRRLRGRRATWLLLAGCATIAASGVAGVVVADRQRAPAAVASRAWHGKVAAIARSGADKKGGLFVGAASGRAELGEGAEIKAGMQLATDARSRARLELDDGTVMVLDRGTTVTVGDAPRTLRLEDGALLADVAHVDGAPAAWIDTPSGRVHVLGTKLAVTAAAGRTNVEVLRGDVEVSVGSGAPSHVAAGQEGVLSDGRIDVAPASDLAQRAAFGEELVSAHNEDAEAPASGLGELRARRPGRADEKDHAVHLARHAVKVRIAGNVARTEIDEVFSNDTADELEGIYRFPLPHGAQIERLALEVDGKLVDGEFVDKAKAAAIWRGAIRNAAPQQPRPREEIVWVPGPWHDPALLEWERGGRFELKIFPIPKKGSRRVVIAYTETVAPVAGIRRYVYPLPQGSSSTLTIDDFSVDAQVIGNDPATPVRVRGYELTRKDEGSVPRLVTQASAFTPSGDLAIEYGMGDRATDASVWAYRAPATRGAEDPVGQDAFVTLALRPKLPKWADVKPRDQVIVLDAGRAMYGERFARAKRLAVQMTQEMDRRDRVTVLACDVGCRALPGGFAAPGAPAAHDVDAFLAGSKPDGASDLVAAVRAATQVSGRDPARDLRVVLLSDGVATAGYRSGGRIANEVADAVTGSAEVVTVPIGADADVALLGEIARGGGGVVVPYQPGQRLEATALEVLNATYGTTLRDVQIELPSGLHDVAPASLPPLRAGSETLVMARLTGTEIKGDVVLRGKVGGDPFEARYPVDAKVSTEAGNAFVPRLFAAARIADRERDATESQRAELVALSRRFSVPSRFTSLLVLESEAMFKAFGIDRAEHAAQWTGEAAATGALVATVASPADSPALAMNAFGGGGRSAAGHVARAVADPFGADDVAEAKKDAEGTAQGFGAGAGLLGGAIGSAAAPVPAATASPAQQDERAARAPKAAPRRAPEPLGFDDPRSGGRLMRRIYVRKASITSGAGPAVAADKLTQARAAVQAAPDERARHKELAKLLAVGGQLDELDEALEKWSARDPLDADVIVGRADLAARRGDREGSLRILSGALAASAMSRDEAFLVATTVGRSYERLGRTEACAFHVTAAELRPADVDVMARAVACERRAGRDRSAERWLGTMKEPMRAAVSLAAAKVDPAKTDVTNGDIVLAATWDGGADVDLALVDPSGRRAGVATRMKGARIEGASSRDHETLALASNDAGSFVIEVVRAGSGEGAGAAVSGKVTVRAFGQTQTLPFTLTGARTQVGRIDARWEAQLVPFAQEGWGPTAPRDPWPGTGFDRGAASSSLGAVDLRACGASGQVGTGHVTVTFAPTGRVSEVTVDDATFSGTPAGRCVASAFFVAAAPAFSGGPVRVGKSFTLGAAR